MEVSLAAQADGFFLSCLVGVALGALFDVFRVIRIILQCEKKAVFFQDIVCFVCAGIITFLTALATNYGELRFYIVAGEMIGICVYFLTLGEITVRLARLLFYIRSVISRFLKRTLVSPIRAFQSRLAIRIGKKLEDSKKNLSKKKKRLKPPPHVVYNHSITDSVPVKNNTATVRKRRC